MESVRVNASLATSRAPPAPAPHPTTAFPAPSGPLCKTDQFALKTVILVSLVHIHVWLVLQWRIQHNRLRFQMYLFLSSSTTHSSHLPSHQFSFSLSSMFTKPFLYFLFFFLKPLRFSHTPHFSLSPPPTYFSDTFPSQDSTLPKAIVSLVRDFRRLAWSAWARRRRTVRNVRPGGNSDLKVVFNSTAVPGEQKIISSLVAYLNFILNETVIFFPQILCR